MNIGTNHSSAKVSESVNAVLKISHYLNDLMSHNQYTDIDIVWSDQVLRIKMNKTSKHHKH